MTGVGLWGRAVAVPPIYLVPNVYSVDLTFPHYFVYYASLTKAFPFLPRNYWSYALRDKFTRLPLARVIQTATGGDAFIPREMGSQREWALHTYLSTALMEHVRSWNRGSLKSSRWILVIHTSKRKLYGGPERPCWGLSNLQLEWAVIGKETTQVSRYRLPLSFWLLWAFKGPTDVLLCLGKHNAWL